MLLCTLSKKSLLLLHRAQKVSGYQARSFPLALCTRKDVSQGEHQQPRENGETWVVKGMEGNLCAQQARLRERAKVLLL